MKTNEATITALRNMLDEERTLLLQGRLGELPGLLERKQKLVKTLGSPSDQDLNILRNQLMRNHDLLNSAMEGIRQVSDRLATLKKMRLSLETYDSRGHRKSLGTSLQGKVEKRA